MTPATILSAVGKRILPPLLRKIEPADYPELATAKLLFDFPGGAIIERDMMTCMRWTCSASLVVTPLLWWRARRWLLTPEARAAVPLLANFQRNLAIGAVGGAALGAVVAVAKYAGLSEHEVVRMAVGLRKDSEQDRWSRTSGRLATAAVIPMIIYTSGSLPVRVACGFGLGMVASIPISATDFDFAFNFGVLNSR